MKTRSLITLAIAGLISSGLAATSLAQPTKLKMTTDIPSSITAPDKVETSIGTLDYFDGVPSEKTVETVYDYLDRSRAVNVYLNSIPALSVAMLREGQASIGCATSNQICIWDTLMDSTTVLLTGNTSTMYAVGFLDLEKDGPTVIDLPPKMLGVLDDMAFHYMTDLGVAGPDKGEGGKFLILPPGYKGDVPEGYFVVPSKTNGVWVFTRGYLDKGIKAASENIRNKLKVYPLAKASAPPKDGVHQRLGQEDEHRAAQRLQRLRKAACVDPAGTRRLPGPRGQGHDGRHRY